MSDDGFFREVDEELRTDRVRKVWQRFGKYIVAAAVALVVVVAVVRGWEWYQNRAAEASGDALLAATRLIEADKRDDALAALRTIEAEGNETYRTLARMKIASVLNDDNRPAEAVAIYDAVAADENADAEQRSLARLRAAMILVDTGTVDDVRQRIGLLATPGAPYRHSARENLGLAYYKARDLQSAFEQFSAVVEDSEAPQGVRERSQLMLQMIASQGGPRRSAGGATTGAITGAVEPATPPVAPEEPAATPGAPVTAPPTTAPADVPAEPSAAPAAPATAPSE